MPNLTALKHDIFKTGPELRDMGASVADDDGILWTARDQMISRDGRSVTLSPDPESLRQKFAKFAKKFGGRKTPVASISKNDPAYSYNRMLSRRGMRRLMARLQRRGLVPKPHTYAELKPTEPKKVMLKPRVNLMMTIQKSIESLQTKPGTWEAMTDAFADAGVKLLSTALPQPAGRIINGVFQAFGPKPRGYAYNFG